MQKKRFHNFMDYIPRYFTPLKVVFFLLPVFFFLVFFPSSASAAANFTCSLSEEACTNTAVLYAQNDTGGYWNAHVQTPSDISYTNVLCCSSLNTTLDSSACDSPTVDQTVLRLYATSNTHVQVNNYSDIGVNYTNYACIIPARGSITCLYALDNCPQDYTCLASIASDNDTFNNLTNAHIGPCAEYITQICCSLEVPNDPPPTPTLLDPEHNYQTTNRTSTFVWSNVTDPDGDVVTYTLNITCYALAGGSCPGAGDDRLINVSTNSTVLTQELVYFIDDGYYYNWTVLATDGMNDSAWADPPRSLNVSVLVDISLIFAAVEFSTLSVGQSAQSLECELLSDPPPCSFNIQNRGNVEIEVNLSENSTNSLFISTVAPTTNYLFRANNASGVLAYDIATSIHQFTPVPRTENLTVLKKFNHTSPINEALVDINITVPQDEPPAYKESTIEFLGYYQVL